MGENRFNGWLYEGEQEPKKDTKNNHYQETGLGRNKTDEILFFFSKLKTH